MTEKGQAADQAAPLFVLQADRKGHIQALATLVQLGCLPGEDRMAALKSLREFDRWSEAHK